MIYQTKVTKKDEPDIYEETMQTEGVGKSRVLNNLSNN